MEPTIAHIQQKLTEAGLKATQQRIVIYQTVWQSKAHPTAEQVFEQARQSTPTISLATIYKTLDTLVEKHLLQKVATPQGSMRYEANLSAHSHIYCQNTQEIIDYQDPELSQLLAQYFAGKNVQNLHIKDIRLQILGEKPNPQGNVRID